MRWLDGITELDGHECGQAPGAGDGQGSSVMQSTGSESVGQDRANELN